MMDTTGFLKNERPNEYEARFMVTGEVHVTIKAESLDEAKAKASAMAEDDEFGTELDDVSNCDISHVWKSPPMFLVMRDGNVMQTSRLADGDLPRQPTDEGF